jgi:hypothetical protein
MKTVLKIVAVCTLGMFDSFLARTYEAIQTLINSRSAVQALKNSNEGYVVSQVFQFDGTVFYGVMILINVLILYLMFRTSFKVNKDKNEETK